MRVLVLLAILGQLIVTLGLGLQDCMALSNGLSKTVLVLGAQ